MANQIESYKKAIDVITDHRFDENAREILIEVMKNNPQQVVDVVEKLWSVLPTPITDAEHIVDGLRNRGWNKIDAIKEDRVRSGRGLKESKDYVEALMHSYNLNTYSNP